MQFMEMENETELNIITFESMNSIDLENLQHAPKLFPVCENHLWVPENLCRT